MESFLQSLDDGWSIYLWLVVGGLIIVAVIYWIRWGMKNEQFDEDIKYLVFDENDKDKMSPQEYAKSREVAATQLQSRERVLRHQEEEKKRDK
ncbi:MAG: hypothetical protein ITD32_01750 [Candidatus Nitrotoga sp.]|jgi:nitrogen fixation-related uncharacterized protein|nr:hypothetical protein [Candidatus Nitrotoga sp.]MBA0902816.1 hypothetical protein [Candidatus Nitrotoga sp.]MBP0116890.1 hypothetical protein [Candidatus Nitrotoga sp.]MBP0118658.1 hypothetical protein [Candidatus Nitrotoga sp.]MBP0123293.1 hypothetical protein [Candidatus Nitrotoga sp.]